MPPPAPPPAPPAPPEPPLLAVVAAPTAVAGFVSEPLHAANPASEIDSAKRIVFIEALLPSETGRQGEGALAASPVRLRTYHGADRRPNVRIRDIHSRKRASSWWIAPRRRHANRPASAFRTPSATSAMIGPSSGANLKA